ncbi:cobalt-zinc-cadmium resistance protein [Agarivorans sp. Toyoura001]|uniref:cation transporter n=1 Tax=Agarivorans sp. Toyoura001 TaxID=2283141 RepID=UPI0010D87792|nr:cation transporter [Agarivorans sp. Toyoura001]GDY25496.1 cobalt-zinc-cadmium resistance protein [Agarivorans sp. Toyoura001]
MFGSGWSEKALLSFSSFSSLFFALLGISLGLWAGSLVIVFDGAYSLVSLALTLVSLGSLALKKHPVFDDKPNKALMIEPAVVAFKGLAISVMCLVSFATAVLAIIHGGRDVDTGLALIFGLVNVVGCVATYWILNKSASQSALLDAEAKQWLMDSVISASVLMGFGIAIVLTKTRYAEFAVYADPVMVILASAYFIWVPLKMTLSAVKQLQQINQVELGY